MTSELVSRWFGSSFQQLHPLLQQLHRNGGHLQGAVEIATPAGLSGVVGRLLAKRMGVPVEGQNHYLQVTIAEHGDGLHWDRCFDHRQQMHSLFQPVGCLPDGYWVETKGAFKLYLTVDTRDGGWHWRCLRGEFHGLSLPLWLLPLPTAYKTIEEGRYRFFVGFNLPLLGQVLSYSGLLTLQPLAA